MNKQIGLWLLLIAAGLAGCQATGPTKPETPPLPAQWQHYQVAAEAALAEPQWWRLLGSEELNQQVAQAQQNNTDLLAAMARLQQAEAQLQLAGASLLPSLSLAGSGQRSGVIGGGDGASSYGLNANASYELDLWGRIRGGRQAAAATLEASRFGRDSVVLTVQGNVVSSYLQWRYLHDSLALAYDNLALAEQLEELVAARVRYGAVSPQDLAQQKTVVANQRARLPQLQQQLQQTRYALAVLLGEVPQKFALTTGSLADLELPEVPVGLPDQVLAQRPDLGQALANLIAADARLAVSRSDYFPALTLTGSGGYRSNALSSLLSGDALYNLGLSLTQNLFDGGARRARVAQAEAQWQEQQANYLGTLLTALLEVDQALGQMAAVDAQHQHRTEAMAQAEQAFALAQVRYREGSSEFSEVLSAQSALNSARQALLDLTLERLQSRVTLFRVLGVGSPALAPEV